MERLDFYLGRAIGDTVWGISFANQKAKKFVIYEIVKDDDDDVIYYDSQRNCYNYHQCFLSKKELYNYIFNE